MKFQRTFEHDEILVDLQIEDIFERFRPHHVQLKIEQVDEVNCLAAIREHYHHSVANYLNNFRFDFDQFDKDLPQSDIVLVEQGQVAGKAIEHQILAIGQMKYLVQLLVVVSVLVRCVDGVDEEIA